MNFASDLIRNIRNKMDDTEHAPKGGKLLDVFQGEALVHIDIDLTHPKVVLHGWFWFPCSGP